MVWAYFGKKKTNKQTKRILTFVMLHFMKNLVALPLWPLLLCLKHQGCGGGGGGQENETMVPGG